MKKRLVFLCCALGLLLATGCSPMPAAPEDLLDAPKLSEKQYEVDRALREQVGQDIKLKYPQSGSYRSAFTFHDVDGDGEEEAIVLHTCQGGGNAQITVMDPWEGDWRVECTYPGLSPDIDFIRFEQLMAGGREAKEALEELDGLCRILERLDLQERVRLDFSIVNDMRYYNGVIFRGYLPGLASGVLAGGRYGNLLRRMGKTGGAIGFAVYLDQLERLDQGGDYDVDVLLLYDPQDDPAAVAERARALAAEGRSVRVERAVPQRLRYRELVRFSEGGQM